MIVSTITILSLMDRMTVSEGPIVASFQSQMPVMRPVSRCTWMLFSRRPVWMGTNGQSSAKSPMRLEMRCFGIGLNRSSSPETATRAATMSRSTVPRGLGVASMPACCATLRRRSCVGEVNCAVSSTSEGRGQGTWQSLAGFVLGGTVIPMELV